jgi:MFS family permease
MVMKVETARQGIEAGNPWGGLSIVLSAAFMAILDVFIVVVAIPAIRADLGAGASETQLVLAAYNLAFGLTLITGGRFGDLYGRRRIFLIGMALFTASSLAASLAPDPTTLIAVRAVQGLAAGLMMPQVFSIIQVSFDDEGRGKAFGAFAFVSGVAATGAQLAGGALLALDLFGLGWRVIFLINVPVGLAAIAAARRFVPESVAPTGEKPSLDLVGVILLTFALLTLIAPLTLGAERGWPWWAWACLALSPVAFWTFARWQCLREARGSTPLVTLSLARNGTFVRGNLMALAFYGNNAVLFLALPLVVQEGFGHSALASGLLFMPLALAFSVTASWAGKLVPTRAASLILLGGVLLLLAYAALFVAFDLPEASGSLPWLIPGALLAGVGMGFVQPSINYLSLQAVSEAEVGSASGVLNTSFELGYALGTIAAGLIFLPPLATSTLLLESFQSAFGHALAFAALLVVFVSLTGAVSFRGARPPHDGGGPAMPRGDDPPAIGGSLEDSFGAPFRE